MNKGFVSMFVSWEKMCCSDPHIPSFSVEPAGEQWLRPGLKKCKCVFNLILEKAKHTFNFLQTVTSLIQISDVRNHHQTVNKWTDNDQ